MAREPGEKMGRKKADIPSRSARIAEDVYSKATIVAAYEGKDVTRYMSDVLRPIVEEALDRHAEQINKAKADKARSAKANAGTDKPKKANKAKSSSKQA